MNTLLGRTLLLLFLALGSSAAHAKPFIYATTSEKAVAVIDANDYSIVATIPVPDFGGRFAVTPDGAFAYIMTGSSVFVIDTVSQRVLTTIPLCCNLYDLAVSPDGAFIYVTGAHYNAVALIESTK